MLSGAFGAFVLITIILLIVPGPLRKAIVWSITKAYVSFLNMITRKIDKIGE